MKKYAVKVFDEERMREFVEEENGPSIKEIIEEIIAISKDRVLQANNAIVLTHTFHVEDKPVGYFAKLIRGGTLLEIKEGQFIPEVSFDEFKEKCELLYQNVINISKEKMIMGDLSDKNIIYDIEDNTFKFIDLDIWTKESNGSIDDILAYNLSNLKEELGEIEQIKKRMIYSK